MRKEVKSSLLAVTLPFLLTLGAANAQTSIFEPAIHGLPEGDFELVLAAEAVFYAKDAPEIGTTENWLNEDNGDHGTARLIEVFEWQGLPCRKIRHIVHVIGEKDMQTVTVDRCQVESGEWKIGP